MFLISVSVWTCFVFFSLFFFFHFVFFFFLMGSAVSDSVSAVLCLTPAPGVNSFQVKKLKDE